MSWTDERVTLLRKMWGEGKTAAEIAGTLGGVTRNAVIGKAHRLKLSNRISPIQQNVKPARPAAPEPRIVARAPARPVEARPPFAIKAVKMIDLKERMCRWPHGDPRDDDFVFCGHERVSMLPYCREHTKLAYQAARPARPLHAPDERQAEIEVKESAGAA